MKRKILTNEYDPIEDLKLIFIELIEALYIYGQYSEEYEKLESELFLEFSNKYAEKSIDIIGGHGNGTKNQRKFGKCS